jgi:hypothetical protein
MRQPCGTDMCCQSLTLDTAAVAPVPVAATAMAVSSMVLLVGSALAQLGEAAQSLPEYMSAAVRKMTACPPVWLGPHHPNSLEQWQPQALALRQRQGRQQVAQQQWQQG